VLSIADVQLVSLKDVPLLRSTLPSKVQANLAVGKPMIGAVAGDAATVIANAQAGLTSRPGDPTDLATAVCRLADMSNVERLAMGERARRYYAENFSERVIGDRLSHLLVDAAQRSRHG
jgi:glycosyltransferase involved in cell wall biosynthesis